MIVWFVCLLIGILSGCSYTPSPKQAEYQYIKDLKDKRVAVLSGSTGDSELNKLYPDMQVTRYEGLPDLIQAIKYGRCDAIDIDGYTAGYLNTEIGGGLVPLDDVIDHLSLAAAFPKGKNQELRYQFNAFLAEIKQSGLHAEIVDKWINHSATAELTPLLLPTEGEPIHIGICSMLPPTSYVKEDRLVGLDIELARYFSQYIHRPIEFLGSNFTSLFASLLAGKTDMVIAGLSTSPERAVMMDFSDAYLNYTETLFVLDTHKKGFQRRKRKEGETIRVQYMNDVVDEPMGVITGSSLEEVVRDHFENARFMHYRNSQELIQALRKGDCFSIGIEDYAFNFLNNQFGGLAKLDNKIGKREFGAVFKKGKNRELRNQFNAFLAEIQANGILQRIQNKWLVNITTAELPKFALPTTGEPIRVATCTEVSPTTFLRNGEMVGLDIELMMYFSLYMKRPVVIEDLAFSDLIASVMNEQVDVAVNGIAITKARKKRMDFSAPYGSYDLVVAVNEENKVGFQAKQGGFLRNDQEWTSNLETRFTKGLMNEGRYLMVFKGLITTVIIAFFSAIFGTLLGALVCFLRLRKGRIPRLVARVYVLLFKGTPILVLLLFLFYVVFNRINLSPTVIAVITFTLNFSAALSTIFRVAIKGVDAGQAEAAISLGFNKTSAFVNIVMPQAFKVALPMYKGELMSMVKMTSIVGYIALEDLTKVSDIISARTFDALFPLVMASALYFLIAWLFTKLVDLLAERVVAKWG